MKNLLNRLILAVFCFFVVFSTLAIDVKLTRYKLFSMELSIILLTAFMFIRMIGVEEITFKKNRLNLPVLAFSLLTAAFYVLSPDKAVAKDAFKSMLFCLLVYFSTANTLDGKGVVKVLTVWFYVSIFVALHGLGSYIAVKNPSNIITSAFSGLAGILEFAGKKTGLPLRNYFGFAHFAPNGRPFATFGNPNFFASYLIAVLPVFSMLVYTMKKHRIVNSAVLLLLLFNLWITATRGAWVGLFATIVVLLVALRKEWLVFIRARKKIFLVIGAILLVFLLARSGFVDEFFRVMRRPTDRLLFWRDSLAMSFKKPLGVGLGAYHIYFPRYASVELMAKLPQDRFIVNHAHNEFLQVLSEMGIAGFSVFMWTIIAFFMCGIKQIKTFAEDKSRYLVAGLLAGGTGILVHNFFSVSMRFTVTSIYLYFIMGLMVSLGRERGILLNIKKGTGNYIKLAVIIAAVPLCWFSISIIHQPFVAHKQLKEEVGFFQKKVVSPEETIAGFLLALEEDPGNAGLHYKIAWIYAKEKKFNEAIKHFEAAVAINPELEGPYNNLGNIYYLRGNKKKAIENYSKAIALDPGKIDAHFNLGYIYYTSGKLKEASDEFNKILELDPKNYKATIMLEKMIQ